MSQPEADPKAASPKPVRHTVSPFERLGPGLVTGAADDDPGGIATHSQAGAQFGLNMLWTVVLTYPLMVAVQMISARIGRVTGKGLAANLKQVFPRGAVSILIALLFVANALNIGADIAAMGAAAALMLGWGAKLFTVLFALVSLLLQLFVPYHRYVNFLKWLTLALFAYVGVVFTVKIDWMAVATHTFTPSFTLDEASVTMIVAIFGTTISPYLFFWQSSEEVEDMEASHHPNLQQETDEVARDELKRMKWDTIIGMGFANLIAFFIILTSASTLHAAGITDVASSAEAAAALKPIAGPLAFLLFSLGIIGTGLLAVPVLAGSVGYAVGELRGWKTGLEYKPGQAKGFYGVIVFVMVVALGVVFSPLDPIKLLYWSAVVNGVISVPLMAAMMIVASRRRQMGAYVATASQRILGWLATGIMAAAVVAMMVLMLRG